MTGGTKVLIAGGSGNIANQRGVGMFFSTTAGRLTVTINLAGTNQAFNFDIGSYAGDFIFYLDIDTAAKICALFVNGTQVGAAQTITANGALPALMWSFGCMIEGNDFTRFAPLTLGGAVITTTPSERARTEGYLAWATGNSASLPGGHPYKLGAP